MEIFLEAQKDVIKALAYDLRNPSASRPMIAVLTDDEGLTPQHFSNEHLRYMYEANQACYFESVQQNRFPSQDEVLSRLENIYRCNGHADDAGRLLADWRVKLEAQVGGGRNPVASARTLTNAKLKALVRGETESFLQRLHKAQDPTEEIADFAHFLMGANISQGQAITLRSVLADKTKDFRPQTSGYARLDGKGLHGPLAAKGYAYGGFTPGRLIVVTGSPGSGKTLFGMNLLTRRAEMGLPGVQHSFEMDRHYLFRSAICSSAKVAHDLAFAPEKAGSAGRRIQEAHSVIEEWMRVYDSPCDLAGIGRRIRRHQVEFGGEMVVHVIDHLGAFVGQSQKAWQQVQVIAKTLKDFGRAYNACIVLMTHPHSDTFIQEWKDKNRVTSCHSYGGRGTDQWADVRIALGRHNGRDLSGLFSPGFANITLFQTFKNRQTKGEGTDDYFGLRFVPEYDLLTDEVVVDDHPSRFREGDPPPLNLP